METQTPLTVIRRLKIRIGRVAAMPKALVGRLRGPTSARPQQEGPATLRECPYCAALILRLAKECQYCRHVLSAPAIR